MKDSSETLTCLFQAERVRKDHPRIVLRGALDELYAKTICAQLVLKRENEPQAERLLDAFLPIISALLSAEYSGLVFSLTSFDDFNWEELHDASHHPQQYFGIGHLHIHAGMGEGIAAMNLLRTKVRDCERLAVSAFDAQREDIVHALNRLSSAVYAYMCEMAAKKEGPACR